MRWGVPRGRRGNVALVVGGRLVSHGWLKARVSVCSYRSSRDVFGGVLRPYGAVTRKPARVRRIFGVGSIGDAPSKVSSPTAKRPIPRARTSIGEVVDLGAQIGISALIRGRRRWQGRRARCACHRLPNELDDRQRPPGYQRPLTTDQFGWRSGAALSMQVTVTKRDRLVRATRAERP